MMRLSHFNRLIVLIVLVDVFLRAAVLLEDSQHPLYQLELFSSYEWRAYKSHCLEHLRTHQDHDLPTPQRHA